MRELDSWLQRQAQREGRMVFLEDALLGNRFWPYAIYRLRYFFLRYVIESAVHLLRFLLLYFIFAPGEFVTLVVLLAVSGLATSFWWGALESMRGKIRYLRRTQRLHLVSAEISQWLGFSIQWGVLLAGVTLLWGLWRLASLGAEFGPVDLYVVAIFLRLSLVMVTRCYHSGIYSLRRIYRPPLAIILVEVLGFGLTLLMWPWLGAWGFSLGSLLAAVIAAGITWHYSSHTYQVMGIQPLEHLKVQRFGNSFGRFSSEWLISGFAYGLMRLDSVLILALFISGFREGAVLRTELFALFFVIGPTVRAGFDWAQLFYFDLKRLELKIFNNLKHRFEKQVLLLSVLLGLGLGVVAGIVGTAAFLYSLEELYLLLLPFFVARSLLAEAQIQCFSDRAYRQVMIGGLLLVSGILAVGFGFSEDNLKLVGLTVVALSTAGLLKWLMRKHNRDVVDQGWLWPSQWLAQAYQVDTPVRIKSVKVSLPDGRNDTREDRALKEEFVWERRRLASRIASRMGRWGSVTLVAPNLIIWFERPEARERCSESWLIRQGGGYLGALTDTGIQPDGSSALKEAQVVVGPLLRGYQSEGEEKICLEQIKQEFAELFPNGMIYDANGPAPREFADLPSRLRRRIIYDAVSFVRDLKPEEGRNGFETSALSIGGELRLIFLVDRRQPARRRNRWINSIRRANLRAALAPIAGEGQVT